METYFTYEMLLVYATCVTAVFGATQFLKELPYIKKIPTKYISFLIAMVIIVVTNIATGSFKAIDIMLYILSAMFISMNANGIYDFDTKKSTGTETTKIQAKEVK